MRVKVGELKAHLSKYLKRVRETGESVEVCVREEPVAWLTPVSERALPQEREEVRRRLAVRGIAWLNPEARGAREKPVPRPSVAGDGRTDLSTVEAMRAEKDW